MQPVDRLTVHVVVDNTTDMLSSRPKHIASELRILRDAGMTELAGEALCSAHHGLCLAYVWGGGPLRGRDACGDLAYFPRFFERPPAFFPENRSDNISLRLAGIIGICP